MGQLSLSLTAPAGGATATATRIAERGYLVAYSVQSDIASTTSQTVSSGIAASDQPDGREVCILTEGPIGSDLPHMWEGRVKLSPGYHIYIIASSLAVTNYRLNAIIEE